MLSQMSFWNWLTVGGSTALAVVTYATPLIPPPYNLAVSGAVTLLSGLLHLNATSPANVPALAAAAKVGITAASTK
jgi:hypothetical protein